MEWKTSKMTNDQQVNEMSTRRIAANSKCLFILGILAFTSSLSLNAQQYSQNGFILSPQPDPAASVANPNVVIQAAPPVEMEANEDFESYNRGPLHEAFATPSSDAPVEGIIVTKQPPESVNELIPEERPDGESVVWIPGYWSYDDDLDDFLWITGVWRDIPPGMRWVPGYWEEVEGGFRWVSGLWMPIETAEIEYVPNPPESLEIGPSSIPPSENYCWIPGNWSYINTSYSWNPGYWAPQRNDYCWAPPRYIYTSCGCVYSPGYWDYAPYRRGLVFAPIRWFRPNRIIVVDYRPRIVINTWRNFYSTLFVCNRRGHYAYGNYFGPRFVDRGFNHISLYNGNRRGFYDPLYNYNRARFGNTFTTQLTGWNSYFERHEDDRPRLTFREEIQLRQLQPQRNQIVPFTITNDLRQVVQRREAPVQITKISNEQLVVVNRVSNELRDLGRERQQLEARDIKLIRNNNNQKIILPGTVGGANNNVNPEIVNKLPAGDPLNNNGNNAIENQDPKLPGRDVVRDNNPNDKKPVIPRTKLSLANNKGLINEQIKQKDILVQEQANVRSRLKPADTNTIGTLPENVNSNNIVPKVDEPRNNNISVDANSRLRVKTGGTDPSERLSIKEKRELGNQNENSTSNNNLVNPDINKNNNSRIIRGNDVSGNPGMNNAGINNPGSNSSIINNPVINNDKNKTINNLPRSNQGQENTVGTENNLPGKIGSTEPKDRLTVKDKRELEKENSSPNLNPALPGSNNNSRVIRGNDVTGNPGINNNSNTNKNISPRTNRGQENPTVIQNNPTNIPGISPPSQNNSNLGNSTGTNKGPTPGEIRRIERQAPPPSGNTNPGSTRNIVPYSGSNNSGNNSPNISAPKIDPPKSPSAGEVRRLERQNSPPPSGGSSSGGSSSPPGESRVNKSPAPSSNGGSAPPTSRRAESRKKE